MGVVEPLPGTVQKPGAGDALLVGQHLGVGDAGCVIDRDVHKYSRAPATDGLASSVQAPAAAVRDAVELLDVDVQQLALTVTCVAHGGRARADALADDAVDLPQARQLPAAHDRTDRRGGQDGQPGQRRRAGGWSSRARTIRSSTSDGVRSGLVRGRDDRSGAPPSPSSRCRRTHLHTVARPTPSCLATSPGLWALRDALNGEHTAVYRRALAHRDPPGPPG